MNTLLVAIHILVCVFIIAIVLLQHGKGADIGATFGGASQTLFGTEGPVPLLNKITTVAAVVFMLTSITLAYLSAHRSSGTVMRKVVEQQQARQAGSTGSAAAPATEGPVVVPMPQDTGTESDETAEGMPRQAESAPAQQANKK